jgi:hypothetical protein
LGGRPVGYPTCDSLGRSLYQPYNTGLQHTAEGYRYELGGGHGMININETNYTMDGRPVAMEYMGTDSAGNPMYKYAYPTTIESTQLGEIEPASNEVLMDAYYKSGGVIPKVPLDTSASTFKRRVFNKVKVGVKNYIARGNDEYRRQECLRTEQYMHARNLSRRMQHTRELERHINRYASYPVKVRRFD